MKVPRLRTVVVVASSLLAALLLASLAFVRWNWSRVHQHCIKGAGLTFRTYAMDHGGRYPTHTNGFGDALALMVADDLSSAHYFVGVDDDGHWLQAAATNKTHAPEERCTRIYVQGLSEDKPEIAMLFDRYATRGGDHWRSPWGHYLREVCLADGSMRVVLLEDWPAFASNQVELLVREGFSRTNAEAYYRPTLGPDAKR